MCEPASAKSIDFDIAARDRFVSLITEFLSAPEADVSARVEFELKEPGQTVAKEWTAANPQTDQEVVSFYKTDSYIFDLAADHCRPHRLQTWNAVVERIKRRGPDQRILIYGDGIGTDSLALARLGHRVTYFDLPGRTSDFARFRFRREGFDDRISVITNADDLPAGEFDAVVCIDLPTMCPTRPARCGLSIPLSGAAASGL